ncbi:hypothetical protein BDA96_05G058600 [Sorghum bicolor]|uniref:Uncharacterized protein n=1 Tax=Sorghum bicolor TaxID=4558 RepID=A0A921QVX9_SORBI|nr:hypothetical protein BDA96_05G058600 [Sorghum bicolor]
MSLAGGVRSSSRSITRSSMHRPSEVLEDPGPREATGAFYFVALQCLLLSSPRNRQMHLYLQQTVKMHRWFS